MAGKISKNGWREEILGYRGAGDNAPESGISHDELWAERKIENVHRPMTYAGPFFFGDDHGCFHGPNEHGCGASGTACGAAYGGMNRVEIHKRCLGAIDRSTHLFAWIDDPSAYGTLVEIGYAKALGKTVVLYFDSGKRHDLWDLWFAAHCGEFAWMPSPVQAWEHFTSTGSDEWSIRIP